MSVRNISLRIIILACEQTLELKGKPELKALVTDRLNRSTGMCHVIAKTRDVYLNGKQRTFPTMNRHMHDIKSSFYKQWGHYSGSYTYPIPSKPHGGLLGSKTSYVDSGYEEMWVEGEYADLRWKFIEDLKEYCENQLK